MVFATIPIALIMGLYLHVWRDGGVKGTSIIRLNKAQFTWMAAIPGIFMTVATMIAGYENIMHNYLPKGKYLLVSLSAIIMVLRVFVIIDAIRRGYDLYQAKETVIDRYGNPVLVRVEE